MRKSIADSEKSRYEIAKEAGITPEMVYRFMSGERDLKLSTVEKLAKVLGLEFTQRRPPA